MCVMIAFKCYSDVKDLTQAEQDETNGPAMAVVCCASITGLLP